MAGVDADHRRFVGGGFANGFSSARVVERREREDGGGSAKFTRLARRPLDRDLKAFASLGVRQRRSIETAIGGDATIGLFRLLQYLQRRPTVFLGGEQRRTSGRAARQEQAEQEMGDRAVDVLAPIGSGPPATAPRRPPSTSVDRRA